jgi:hypothetical protein
MMANHNIPLTSDRIEALAVTAAGRTCRTHVYKHTRQGHTRPEFYIVQYAELPNGRIDRSTRWTRQFSGDSAPRRLERAMTVIRAEFAKHPAVEAKPVGCRIGGLVDADGAP